MSSVKKIINAVNSRPLDDFLGLSPDQVFRVMYGELDSIDDICSLNVKFDQGLLAEVQVAKEVRKLLGLVGEAGEAKATENGFLPKKIVNAVFTLPILKPDNTPYTIQSEQDYPIGLALRHSMTDCGWLKIRNKKFSLTKEGEKVVERNFGSGDYVKLLRHWMRKYNWAFPDGYDPCSIVQATAVFSLYALHLKAQEYFPFHDFSELFMRAFPSAVGEIEPESTLGSSEEEELSCILRLRFIERFCEYFGLVECEGVSESILDRERDLKIKTTSLFDNVFSWLPAEKRKIFLDEDDEGILH